MPRKLTDEEIKSHTYGRLSALERVGKDKSGAYLWKCKCSCGNEVIVRQNKMRRGEVLSCGCLKKDTAQKRAKPYNHRERLYVLWCGIKQRCENPNNTSYKIYGGRGITVCEEWRNNYLAFKKWAIDSGYDETLPRGAQTIERVDVNKGYEPNNCTWKSIREQQRNKRTTRLFEYNGEKHTIIEWSEKTGIDYELLHQRIFSYGWDIKDAIERPKYKMRGKDYIYVEYFGETKSLFEISKETGISHAALMRRYKKGFSIEEVVREYRKNGNSFEKKYSCNGKTLSIKDWSKELGVSENALRYRIEKGKSAEEVFTRKAISG